MLTEVVFGNTSAPVIQMQLSRRTSRPLRKKPVTRSGLRVPLPSKPKPSKSRKSSMYIPTKYTDLVVKCSNVSSKLSVPMSSGAKTRCVSMLQKSTANCCYLPPLEKKDSGLMLPEIVNGSSAIVVQTLMKWMNRSKLKRRQLLYMSSLEFLGIKTWSSLSRRGVNVSPMMFKCRKATMMLMGLCRLFSLILKTVLKGLDPKTKEWSLNHLLKMIFSIVMLLPSFNVILIEGSTGPQIIGILLSKETWGKQRSTESVSMKLNLPDTYSRVELIQRKFKRLILELNSRCQTNQVRILGNTLRCQYAGLREKTKCTAELVESTIKERIMLKKLFMGTVFGVNLETCCRILSHKLLSTRFRSISIVTATVKAKITLTECTHKAFSYGNVRFLQLVI